jgi:dolichyl-phosphate-mannose-protein mannosyltransferase
MERMTSGVVVHAEPAASRAVPPGSPERGVASGGAVLKRWLGERLNIVSVAVIAAGFAARVIVAGRSFLNPDEVLHYIIINQYSPFFTYRLSLTNAHPPLIYLLLYYWRFLGRSELMLRFPSVLMGTALCWVAYKWIETLFGKTAGVIGLVLVAFSPAMIALAAELRSYALLLFCETTALYFLEIAFKEKSVLKTSLFSIFLSLAILSHYSAAFFALAAGIYALLRIFQSEIPKKVMVAWAVGQAGALAVCGFLYATHISKLKHSMAGWFTLFDQAGSPADRRHLLKFTRERTLDIFSFIFQNQHVAQFLLLLWIGAISVLLIWIWTARRETLRARYAAILLLLPIAEVWGTGVAGFYPYVGSRHTAFLAPFVIAALSYVLAAICKQKVRVAVVIAVLLAGASNTSGKAPDSFITKENQSRALMGSALNYVQQTIPPGGKILTDYQSAIMLVYYLCGPKYILPEGAFNLPVSRVRCSGYTIGSFQTWAMEPDYFLSHFEELARAQNLKPGDRVWFFGSGWNVVLGEQLPGSSSKFRCLAAKNFGANITIIPFVVDQDWSPAATATNCYPPA